MPDTTTLPKLEGFDEHFGILVSCFGEDGDLVALGHHSPKRTLAAMRAYHLAMFGPEHGPEKADEVDKRFGSLMTACDPERREPGHNEETCRECKRIRSEDWWMRVSSTPSRDSFPVMHWSV